MYILLSMAIVFPLLYTPTIYSYYYLPKWLFLLLVSTLILIEIVLRRKHFEWHRLTTLPGKWWLVSFYIFITASSIFSPYKTIAFIGEPSRLTGLLTYLMIGVLFIYAYLIFTPKKLLIVMKAMLVTASLLSIYGIAQHYGFQPHFLQPASTLFTYGLRSSATVGNPNFYGTYLMIMFLIGCFLFLQEKVWWYVIGVALVYGDLLTTLSRSDWIGAFVAFLIIGLLSWKKRHFQILSLLLVFVTSTIYFTSPYFQHRLSTASIEMTDLQSNFSSFGSERGYIWEVTWHALENSNLQELVIGTGPDTLYSRLGATITTDNGVKVQIDKAHDIYLEKAVTLGMPALISLLMFYLSLFRWRRKNSIAFALSLILLAYLVQGIFNIDVILVYPLFMLLIAGLAYAKNLPDTTYNSEF